MRKEELMLGDYVYNTHNKQAEQVQEIGSGLVMLDYNDLYEYDEIEPIPLTVEILEVNGFNKDDYNYYYHNDDESLEITFFPKDKNYTRGLYDYISINRGCITIDEFPIEHVHQLQHAMRLCDIDKEITIK